MKHIRILFTLAAVLLICSASTKKEKKSKEKEVYAFGVAASFNDTVVYFTEIQKLDSVKLERKTKFLPNRDLYSYQLKNYLEYQKRIPNYTCMIYFSSNKAKLGKELIKVKGKYKKNKETVFETIDSGSFLFKKPEE